MPPLRLGRFTAVVKLGIALAVGVAVCADARVAIAGFRRVHAAAELPAREVGLVLGTAPRVAGGARKNLHFEGRMDLAARLHAEGKVRHLLISGDNGTRRYDEPTAMRDALLARGVPASAMTLDYAGFRTLDSIARAKSAFGIESLTVITDDFHLARALYLAQAHGIDAIGCAADTSRYLRWSIRIREHVARIVAVFDVAVSRGPRFGT